MNNPEQTYKKVAEHCSSYKAKKGCCCSNKSGDSDISCTTCQHFNATHHCELDLLDPIVENHKF